ncbi:MAG: sigma-70 family RNA polymerase sigma factor [Nitrosarchaeum sp.]|nr:sigma-70 family RNA polymerase sigma factor [Nitrosarchaeum sp.]
MLKVLFSSKLAALYRRIRTAADWRDRYVFHLTPTGQRNRVLIRSLPVAEQERYKPVTYHDRPSMTMTDIQSSVADYQETGSQAAFRRLYQNFLPTIAKTMSEVIGSRRVSKEDAEDIKTQADLIFLKAIRNADPNNNGILAYIKETLTQQLKSKSREIIRSEVKIPPKDDKLRRAVERYRNEHAGEDVDYNQMARDINADPTNNVTHATAKNIQDLLQVGSKSGEQAIDQTEGDQRTLFDVLGPSDIAIDEAGHKPAGFMPTPEEELATKELEKHVLNAINGLNNPEQEKIIKLHLAVTGGDENLEKILNDQLKLRGTTKPKDKIEGLNHREIAKALNVPKSTVKRELSRAMAKIRQMGRMDPERFSKSFRIMKAFNKHVRFAYDAKTIVKRGASYVIDNEFVVRKYGSQLVCSCGKNCYHKDVVKNMDF